MSERYFMFYLTLAKWCIVKLSENGWCPGGPMWSTDRQVQTEHALRTAYSELGVAQGLGASDFFPDSTKNMTQLTEQQLSRLVPK